MIFERLHGRTDIWDNGGLRQYLPRRWGFLWFRDYDELRPIGESCVRKNPHKRDADDFFIGAHRDLRYQMWRKHLFTKKGVCRRCGFTTARREELKETIRYWEKPLVITPIQREEK
jgi:hypothetical protein